MGGKQASAGPLSYPTQQLREASAYDMQTLRMENADIRAKFLVMEREYDRERFELRSLSACHEEMLSRKNDSISDNQCIVNEFKAKESKIKMRQANLEEALKQEKTRNSELHHTVDQISSSLEKERTRCEKHRVELQEALKQQITTLEENNKLTLSLQKAQETFPRLQEKQRAETNYNFGNIVQAQGAEYSLDESNKALYHLQQEYTNLGRRHCDINAEYCELLKTHTAPKSDMRGSAMLRKPTPRLQSISLPGDRGANSRLEEAIKKEKANFSRASKKIQSQEKELEKKRFEKMVAKQTAAGPLSILAKFLRLSLKSEKKRSQIVPCQSPRKGEV
ncbi:hypothetical protein F7725_027797 [Dissostichus mawsoni]|uniref:Uncharacterized protein n=1 Tax=Dissostichus mawsoni TaxID=36200 RepID=A0A7J5XEX3_DISMA|nr:hypothetical protein F7725_027797 [Dissostichus mawsoni]